MDGNGRWAKRRHLPRIAGHKAGLSCVRKVVQRCAELGIDALTLFAFSSENWRRPPREVSLLMDLFRTALSKEVHKLNDNKICLRIIGDRSRFSKKLVDYIERAERLTADNNGLRLVIAVNYGGRWDITQAATKLAQLAAQGQLQPEDITEQQFHEQLCMSDLVEPDLFIRTGGEKRVSNFLLWQLAYTELYFTDTLWPDFDEEAFAESIISFTGRQRRFGRTGDQVEERQGNRA